MLCDGWAAMARIVLIIVVGLFHISGLALCTEEGEPNYDNYSLVKLTPQNESQLQLLRGFAEPVGAEVLKHSRGLNDSLDLLVESSRRSLLQKFAEDRGIDFLVKHHNFRRSLEESIASSSRRSLRGFDVFSYNNYDTIQEFLLDVAAKYPACVRVESIGSSYERRPMRLVKISSDPSANNPVIFVDAGVHAREWVAPAMALYLVQRLADNCEEDGPESPLRGVDWFILPVVNPDGYEFSRNSNRMWRKTRSQYRSGCKGVDGNRNYGFHWGVSGTNSDPCDPQTYPGPKPFSEAETRHVRDVMLRHAARIKLYVSLHAYGQYLVYPWGYTGAYLPESWRSLERLAKAVSAAVVRAGGRPFRVLSAGRWYAAAGGSDDYAFGAAKIPYSYTMELTDGYEFAFPEEQLRDVLPQFYEGFRVFRRQIARQFGE